MSWNTIGAAMAFGATGFGVGTQAEIVDFGLANIGWGMERLSGFVTTDEIPCDEPNAEDMLLEHEAIVMLDSAVAPRKTYTVSPGKIGRCYHSDVWAEETVEIIEDEVANGYEDVHVEFEVDASEPVDESDCASDWDDDDFWLADFELNWEPAIDDEHPFYDWELEFDGDTNDFDEWDRMATSESLSRVRLFGYGAKVRITKPPRRIHIGVPTEARSDILECIEWLKGRRVLRENDLFYWETPVFRQKMRPNCESYIDPKGIIRDWPVGSPIPVRRWNGDLRRYEYVLEVSGYRRGELLSGEDVEYLNGLDSHCRAKAFEGKASIANTMPYWRYPHWEKRRPQSWKRGKFRRQWGNPSPNPFKGQDGFGAVVDEPEWDVESEESLLANVEAYHELIREEERIIELERLECVYDGFVSDDAYDMWEPHGFFRDPYFEEDRRNFLDRDYDLYGYPDYNDFDDWPTYEYEGPIV